MIEIKIKLTDIKVTSTNAMYYTGRRIGGKKTFRTKTKEYLEFISKIEFAFSSLFEANPELKTYMKTMPITPIPNFAVVVGIPLASYYTKKFKIKAIDASNFIKTAEDSVFKYLSAHVNNELDDRLITTTSSTKVAISQDEWTLQIWMLIDEPRLELYKYEFTHTFERNAE